MFRIFDEPARVVEEKDGYILAETAKAYWIVEKDSMVPVQWFSKEAYSLEDVLEEFQDFIKC